MCILNDLEVLCLFPGKLAADLEATTDQATTLLFAFALLEWRSVDCSHSFSKKAEKETTVAPETQQLLEIYS